MKQKRVKLRAQKIISFKVNRAMHRAIKELRRKGFDLEENKRVTLSTTDVIIWALRDLAQKVGVSCE